MKRMLLFPLALAATLVVAAASGAATQTVQIVKSGFTPDYDAVGGSMGPVVKNTANLTDADRAAMAEYLKSLPPVKGEKPKKAAE